MASGSPGPPAPPGPPGTALGRIATRAVLVWFLVALGLGATGTLDVAPGEAPWALVGAVALPLVAAVHLYLRFADVRRFAHSLDARWVTLAQTLRLGGLTSVALGGGGGLPAAYGAVAAWDGLVIGATAPFVAFVMLAHRPPPKGTFALWNAVGLFDLAALSVLAVLTGPGAWGVLAAEAGADALTGLPWSLVPTFFVPLFAVLHLVALARARESAS